MNYIIIFYNLSTTILQLVQQIYSFLNGFYPNPLQFIYNYFITCHNPNNEFMTKYEVQGPNEGESVFRT